MLRQKFKTLIRYVSSGSFSLSSLCRYAFGQVLAYSGIGKWIAFTTKSYKLYLTKSPVAMVLFGFPEKEREEESLASTLLKKGDVVVDIGANIGTFSLAAATAVGNEGRVFAFEAHPRTAAYAERNIKLNRKENIMLIRKALGDKEGTLAFSNDAYDDINHIDEQGEVKVPVIQLDRYEALTSVPLIKLIKIDVEGYELPVLKGAKEVLSRTEILLFELFDQNYARYGYNAHDIIIFLQELHFDIIDPTTGTSYVHDEAVTVLQNLIAYNRALVPGKDTEQ